MVSRREKACMAAVILEARRCLGVADLGLTAFAAVLTFPQRPSAATDLAGDAIGSSPDTVWTSDVSPMSSSSLSPPPEPSSSSSSSLSNSAVAADAQVNSSSRKVSRSDVLRNRILKLKLNPPRAFSSASATSLEENTSSPRRGSSRWRSV